VNGDGLTVGLRRALVHSIPPAVGGVAAMAASFFPRVNRTSGPNSFNAPSLWS
jgi:hypothetical protein